MKITLTIEEWSQAIGEYLSKRFSCSSVEFQVSENFYDNVDNFELDVTAVEPRNSFLTKDPVNHGIIGSPPDDVFDKAFEKLFDKAEPLKYPRYPNR